MRVRIQSLNIPTLTALSHIIYHQTGIKYVPSKVYDSTLESRNDFVKTIKDIEFTVIRIFELEGNFIDSGLNPKWSQIKHGVDESLGMLRFFREYSVNIDYVPIQSEMSILLRISPPVYHWVRSISNWNRKVLLEKHKEHSYV